MKQLTIKEGINLYQVSGEKFKTTIVSVKIHCPLNIQTATANALLPLVLKQGSSSYPTMRQIELVLAELYGGELRSYVEKKGEDQILCLEFKGIRDEYTPQAASVVLPLCQLMLSVVFFPYTENGGFKQEYVELAKNNLSDMIDSLFNDRREYALYRCKQLMCIDEPYGVSPYGSKHQLAQWDGKSLYEHYQKVLAGNVVDIYVCGSAPIEKVAELVGQVAGDRNTAYPQTHISPVKAQVKYLTETIEANQAKLAVGFRCMLSGEKDEYFALCVVNSIFGGGVHSRLFIHVREKLSLAYYAATRLDKHKAIITADAGILLENYEKTLNEIRLQLADLQAGNISQTELDAAKASITNMIRASADSQTGILDFALGEILAGRQPDIESFCASIKGVTASDVCNAAKKIQEDTVYLLCGKGGCGHEA